MSIGETVVLSFYVQKKKEVLKRNEIAALIGRNPAANKEWVAHFTQLFSFNDKGYTVKNTKNIIELLFQIQPIGVNLSIVEPPA